MIVAIINQTAPAGKVRVEEFRDTVDETAAVDGFVNDYTPPKSPADYLGYDSGWGNYQRPASGFYWAYDFDAPGLVQVSNAESFEWRGGFMAIPSEEAVPGLTPFAWETMGQLSADLGFAFSDITKAQIRVWGRYKADKGGGAGPELRLSVNSVDLGAPLVMADSAAWVNFVFWTTAVLDVGRRLYKLQAKLGDAAATMEIDATTLVLLEKQF